MDLLIDFLTNLQGPAPYFAVFGVLIACGLGVPIPEDITLFAAGMVAYYEMTPLWSITLVSFAGVMLGDCIVYFLGSHFGGRLTQHAAFRRLFPPERLDEVKIKLHDKGDRLLFAARFMPGFRSPIFFSAGMLHIPFRRFFFYDGVAALISVPAIVCSVYYFGDELDKVVKIIKRIEHGIFFVILSVVAALIIKWALKRRKK